MPTSGISSYAKAREIAGILKEWIDKGDFLLNESVQMLPGPDEGLSFKALKERS